MVEHRFICCFRRVRVRNKQAVETEIGFTFMTMNLTKLVKNLASKISIIQKTTQYFFLLDGIQD